MSEELRVILNEVRDELSKIIEEEGILNVREDDLQAIDSLMNFIEELTA